MQRFSIVKCTSEGISQCLETLRAGGVIVFPTDTVYGLGCDPYNDSAVERVFQIKSRDFAKPLPVLTYSQDDAQKIVELGSSGRSLAQQFWPGKLTILAPLVDYSISSKVTAGGKSLGVRVPSHKRLLALLRDCRYLVGTSANTSGHAPARSADEVQSSGLSGFDLLLDGGKIEASKESTVVDLQSSRLIREGAINAREIYRVLGVQN